MKKFISGLLILVTLTGLMVPAFAEDISVTKAAVAPNTVSVASDNKSEKSSKISNDEAKKIATKFLKEYCDIEIDEKACNISSYYRENPGRSTVSQSTYNEWELQYQYNDGFKGCNYAVVLNSDTGKITRYNRNEYFTNGQDDKPKVAVISEEQAYEKALSFIEKVYPGVSKNIIKDDRYKNYYGMSGQVPPYSFFFVRQVNGLKFNSNSISIGVDGITGKVASFNCNWNEDLNFPDANPAVSMDKAFDTFYKEADMNLSYNLQYKSIMYSMPKDIKLVYGADFKNGTLLDAKSGTLTKYSNYSYDIIKTKDLSKEQKEQLLSKYEKTGKNSKELDESAATELIKSIITKTFGPDYEIMSNSVNFMDRNNYYADGENSKVWTARFTKKGDEKNYGQFPCNVTINAQTGELMSIDLFNAFESQDTASYTPKLSWDEAYDKAINLVSELFPDKVKDIRTEQKYVKQYSMVNNVKMPERYYSFNFGRQVNGIPFLQNALYFRFDNKTGEVCSIHCSWNDNLDFQKPDNILNKDEAKKAYFKEFTPELTYEFVNTSTDSNKPNYEIKLVYRLNLISSITSSSFIDASTGELFKYTTENDKTFEAFKKEINGHWGEKELQILAYQNIIDIDTFKPDEEITRMDALKMLVNAKGYYFYGNSKNKGLKFTNIDEKNDNYRYLLLAVQYGLIDDYAGEFKGEDKITREEMAELLVKLLKYDRLAKCEIYKLPFSDAGLISEDKFGSVAIGTGLGFFNGDNGEFRPKDNTTMAEFAITIYKALSDIKNNEK